MGIPSCSKWVVRKGAFIGKNVVLMPSFVNLGAYVDEGTRSILGHLLGHVLRLKKLSYFWGAGIGGVLEPLAGPVIIEDNCFIGARSEIAEGVLVEEGAYYQWGLHWCVHKNSR